MPGETNQVTQIYELRSLGFKQVTGELDTINKQFKDIAENKQAAGKGGSQLLNSGEINKMKSLLEGIRDAADKAATANDTTRGQLAEISKLYQEAATNAQAYSTELGVSSEKYKEATAQADLYRKQLLEIDDLLKRGTGAPPAPGTSPSAPNTPTSAPPPQQTAQDIQRSVTPLLQYTGALEDNLLKIEEYRQKLAQLGAQIKANGGSDAAQLKQQRDLKIAAADLNQTITQQTQYLLSADGSMDKLRATTNIYKDVYRGLSDEVKRSDVGKTILTETTQLDAQLKAGEQKLGNFKDSVGNYKSAFTGLDNSIQQILRETPSAANSINTFFLAISNNLPIFFDQVQLVNGTLKELKDNLKTANEQLAAQKLLQEGSTKAAEDAEKALSDQVEAIVTSVGASEQQAAILRENIKNEVAAAGAKAENAAATAASTEQIALNAGATLEDAAALRAQTEATILASAAAARQTVLLEAETLAVVEANVAMAAQPGVLKRIGSSIFSLNSLLTAGVLVLTLFGGQIVDFISGLFKSADAVDKLKLKVEDLNKGLNAPDYVKGIENINQLRININLAKEGFLNSDSVIKQYNETIGKTTGQVSSLDEAQQALVKNSDAYLQVLLYQAAAHLAVEDAAKKAKEAEELRRKKLLDFITTGDRFFQAAVAGDEGAVLSGRAQKDADKLSQEQAKTNQKEQVKIAEDGQKAQLEIGADFQKKAAELAKKFNFNFFGDAQGKLPQLKKELTDTYNQIATVQDNMNRLGIKESTQLDALIKRRQELKKEIADIEGAGKTGGKGDSLGSDNNNALNLIDAQLKDTIAAENIRVNILRKSRELTYDEERQHLENILAINDKYAALKIKAIQGNNTKERQARSAIYEQQTELEASTGKAIDAVNKKQFEERVIQLKEQNDEVVRLARQQFQDVQDDPSTSASQRADAKLDLDRQLISAQVSFNIAMDAQEQLLKQHSEKNTRERLAAMAKLEEQGRQDRLAVGRAAVQDIREAGDRQALQINISYAEMRLAILSNDRITEAERQRQLAELEKAQKRTLLSAELEQLNKEVAEKKRLYKLNLISNEEYLAAVKRQKQKAGEVQAASSTGDQTKTQKFLAQGIGDSGITIGQVISDSFDLARDAMNEYFDAESARIQASRQQALDRLQTEQDTALKAAQARGASTAEQAKIESEFQKKKDVINKEASDKLKKNKKAELAISLATEIAHIAEQAAGNPLNYITAGAAGAIQFGILSAFALARGAVQLAQINRQQFEYGGEVPTRGGRFGGQPHSRGGTPFGYRNRIFEAEVGELAVVRTHNVPAGRQYTITGNHTQIASALNQLGGGVGFANGARVQKYAYGGVPGSQLQPPLRFTTSSSESSAGDRQLLAELQAQNAYLMANLTAISSWASNLQVQQVTNTVTDAQRKAVNQASVATIGKRTG